MRVLRFARRALIVVAALACALLVVLLVMRQVLVASLPQVEGTRTLPGLSAPVRVERDTLGIPTIRGVNRLDVARATGFVHAQDRFFQMDVARRFAAGELSELVGPAALATDKTNRVHRLRAVARDVLARALPGERALLQTYADGVNAGLAALGARPPEYLLLRAQPAAWLPEDSVLVVADGRALVANDPHLPLRVPNIWYRLSLDWRDERAIRHRVTGASLPGLPFIAIGSNGHVAWGFTVAFDDRSDMVIVEIEGAREVIYRTPDGPRRFEHTIESITVKGGADVRLDITSTIWGPLVGRDPDGHPLAQQWQAQHPDGITLTFAQMEYATTVEQPLDIANRSGLPSYNTIVADDRGSIGWTVTGRLPRRVGFDGRIFTSWADGTRRWDGWLDRGEYPRMMNPPSGRVWSANNRPVDRPLLDRLGLEGYIMGPRARQVRDDLMARDRSTPRDSLRIQLDDRALLLERWRAFLLEQLRDQVMSGTPQRREFRRLIDKSWDGRASVPSVGYLLVERFRYEIAQRVIGPMLPSGVGEHALRPGAISEWWEGALWRLVHAVAALRRHAPELGRGTRHAVSARPDRADPDAAAAAEPVNNGPTLLEPASKASENRRPR